MSKLDRIVERVRDSVSRVSVPAGRRRIIHSRAPGFDLLVRADEEVGRAIHFVRNFEIAETRYLRRAIPPDAVCADVGANIGYFTMLMAAAAPQGLVHAFEPLALNVALIGASAALNGFENVRINRTLVGDAETPVEFTETADSAYSSLRDTGRGGAGRSLEMPMTTLDTYLAGGRLDVLKIDVEGAEALVLAGAAGLLADPARRPVILMVELCQANLDGFGVVVGDVVATLRTYGYEASMIRPDGELTVYDAAACRQYNLAFTAART